MSWIVMELLVGWAGAALGAGPSCSTESWPRRQEVISRRAATAVIYHQYQWLTAAYLSGIDWRTVHGGPKRCGQSMGAFHSPWTSAFWSSPLIGRARSDTVGIFSFFSLSLYYEKEWEESDERFGVGSLLSFSRMCMAYVRESCCVPPHTAKNPQISLRGLIQICTLISVHIIPPQRYGGPKKKCFFTPKVSLDYLHWSTCVICERSLYSTCRFHGISELCLAQLTFEVVKADCTHDLPIFSKLTFACRFWHGLRDTVCSRTGKDD